MTRDIERRLGALERAVDPPPGAMQHILWMPHGFDEDQALAEVGLSPGPDDLVVFLLSFLPTPNGKPAVKHVASRPMA